MDVREKLFTLFQDCNNPSWKWFPNNAEMLKLIDYLIAHGVTVQEHVEKGCDICNGIKPLLLETDIGYTWIVKGKMENAYGDCKIRYCPMCGRELPQPPKGE